MIDSFVTQWDANKERLADYFRTTDLQEINYDVIARKLFEIAIPVAKRSLEWDLDNMTILDHGHYQGTQIFIIPVKTYQPDVDDYVYTHNYYGSCSGCDTLQAIVGYRDKLPNEEQVKELMDLALHMMQRAKWFLDEEATN